MMKTSIIAVVVQLLLTLPVLAGDFEIFGFHVGKKRYTYTLDMNVLSSSPTWDPSKETMPPLSQEYAVKTSLKELPKYTTRPEDYFVSEIKLRRYGKSDSWYYEVVFLTVPLGQQTTEERNKKIGVAANYSHIRIVVLLSGKVLEPEDRSNMSKDERDNNLRSAATNEIEVNKEQ